MRGDHGFGIIGVNGGARPQFQRQCALFRHGIDGNHRLGARCDRAEHRRQANTAQAPDRDTLAGPHLCRVEHGANARQHGATEQRSNGGRHISIDFHR